MTHPDDAGSDVASIAVPSGMPPEVGRKLLRTLDRSPSAVVVLIDADLHTHWVSRSAAWVTGTDPTSRAGRGSLERVHPDDVEPLVHALDQVRSVTPEGTPTVPVVEPLRYRVDVAGRWVTMESIVLNMMGDPETDGFVVIGRPAGGELDGTGAVVDLLVADAPLAEVLAACARLVPGYLGETAVIARVEDGTVVGTEPGSAAERLARQPRWWEPTLEDGKARQPSDFAGFAPDLVAEARAEGFSSVWVSPVTDTSKDVVVGCLATWVRVKVERNVATDQGLFQAERLAGLVIGEQRRYADLQREVITDPLTRVRNRSALRRRLDDAAQVGGDGGADAGELTVAVFDLDDFKPINDTYGHDIGDVVLQVVAERISSNVRGDDLVVRLGGDEFAVVFAAGTSMEDVEGSVRRIVGAITEPIVVDGLGLSVGVSAGQATGPAVDVMRAADRALYVAKADKPARDGRRRRAS